MNRTYVVSSAVLFSPPVVENEIGHYVCAVRFNKSWEVYDDLRNGTYSLRTIDKVHIHALHYIEQ